MTGAASDRAVIGSAYDTKFTLSNFSGGELSYELSASGAAGTPSWTSTPLPDVAQRPLTFVADTSGTAGSFVTVGLTATEPAVGTPRSSTYSYDVQLVENRTIGFTLSNADGSKVSTGGTLDLGRFIGSTRADEFTLNPVSRTYSSVNGGNWDAYGTSLKLTLSGGNQSHDEATDVHWAPPAIVTNPWSNLQNTSGGGTGLYFTSGTGYQANRQAVAFDGAGISKTLDLNLYQSGVFSQTIDLTSSANLGGGFQAESISGAAVQYAGGTVTVQGTALSNRTILASASDGLGATSNHLNTFGLVPSLGSETYQRGADHLSGGFDTDAVTSGVQNRVMVGSSGNIAAGSAVWTLTSPSSSDSAALVNFTGSGVKTSGALSVDTGAAGSVTTFDGTTSRQVTASWGAMTYGATGDFNTASSGNKTLTVNLTGNLSSGEAGGALAGQQYGNLAVSHSLEVVDNRPVTVSNLHKTALNGVEVNQLQNRVSGTIGSYTNPTITNQNGDSWVMSNHQPVGADFFTVDLGTTGTGNGSRTLTVTPEGLAGERAAYNLSYDWSLSRVNSATVAVSGSLAGSLEHDISRGAVETGNQLVGTFSVNQTNAGAGNADASVSGYEYSSSKGWSVAAESINSGRGGVFNFSFDDTGLKDGTYFYTYQVVAQHANQGIIGTAWGDLGSYTHIFEATVTGRGTNDGYKGFRLSNFNSTSAVISEGTATSGILGIADSSSDRAVTMEYLAEGGTITSLNGTPVGFAAFDVTGLDGLTFVLESNYDEDSLVSNFGTEDVAVLLWKNEYGDFINAVLGNHGDAAEPFSSSNSKLGTRYAMSYESYLASLGEDAAPRLGDYGYDTASNKVWAVLDHNSTFGGSGSLSLTTVPEPSGFLLVLAGGTLAVFRRRRD